MNKQLMEWAGKILWAIALGAITWAHTSINSLKEANIRLEERVQVLKERMDGAEKKIERRGWREGQR